MRYEKIFLPPSASSIRIILSPWKLDPLFFEEKTLFSCNSLLYLFSYYRMIVILLTEGEEPGKSSDKKYVTVTRTYDNQVDGEPYITAEFANNEERTEFPVGDGLYYSRDGVTETKRKRRATSELLFSKLGFFLRKHFYFFVFSDRARKL